MRSKLISLAGCLALVLLAAYASSGHLHAPGHGNWENKNFEESVVSHVSSQLAHGERVEFGGKYLCEDYKEDGEARFSAYVDYYVVAANGAKQKRTACVICNEDKNQILDWEDL
ncbi:MAG: hypothetical protein IJ808_07700 [Muribaculaceae bacterium]|nr:hypothetical protein [Muribaculaceae bacterium]